MSSEFQTFQTKRRYDEAIGRHGQWVRWMKSTKCPCVDPVDGQPDPQCDQCIGRGWVYRPPKTFTILQEVSRRDGQGRVYPRHTPVSNVLAVKRNSTDVPFASPQPSEDYIKLDPPYPPHYAPLTVDYEFSVEESVTADTPEVIGSGILRVQGTDFSDQGKRFEGTITGVTRVENLTRNETYTVSRFEKEYIYLDGMGTYQNGDELGVDFTYVGPFYFVLSQITQKMRYESAYVLADASAQLVCPAWAMPSDGDIFTQLAGEIPSREVVEPAASSGDDEIHTYFDIAYLVYAVDQGENEYTPGEDFELVGRNKIHWISPKPSSPYTVEFTYHPTFVSIVEQTSMRRAENKEFANKINLKELARTSQEVTF